MWLCLILNLMPIWSKDPLDLKAHQVLEDHLVKEVEEAKEARAAKPL